MLTRWGEGHSPTTALRAYGPHEFTRGFSWGLRRVEHEKTP